MHSLNTKALYVLRAKAFPYGNYRMRGQAPTTATLNQIKRRGRKVEDFEVVRYEIVERETMSADEYLAAIERAAK